MTFDQLQYFITIAKTGNMTRAAEQLNVVQPALSRAIKRLETELDVKLFDRTGKSVVLNANGTAFLKFAEQCVNSFHKLHHLLSNEELHGSLLIGNMLENIKINRAIVAFSNAYPNIHLEIIRSPKKKHPSMFHFFFGTSAYESSYLKDSLQSVELWQEPMSMLVSKDHPLADHKNIRLSDAKDYSFILPCDTEFSNFINHFFELADFQPLSYFKTNDQSMLTEMIRGSNCVALTPAYCNLYVDKHDFRIIPLTEPEYIRHTFLYRPIKDAYTSSEQAFFDFITGYFIANPFH